MSDTERSEVIAKYHRVRLQVRQTIRATGMTKNKVKRAWVCRECGCIVFDQKLHDSFHSRETRYELPRLP